MKDFKKNVKKDLVPIYTCKKRPGPNLTNSRNYTYSAGCNYHYFIDFGWNKYWNVKRR